VMGSVTALAKMTLALVANVVGMMERAMRWDAATDNARYRVLWSCLGTWMEWVFLLHGVVVVASGVTGTTGGGAFGGGAGSVVCCCSAAFLSLRCCRRRCRGLRVATVYVLDGAAGGTTLGSGVGRLWAPMVQRWGLLLEIQVVLFCWLVDVGTCLWLVLSLLLW
jgi:hypothetical protein